MANLFLEEGEFEKFHQGMRSIGFHVEGDFSSDNFVAGYNDKFAVRFALSATGLEFYPIGVLEGEMVKFFSEEEKLEHVNLEFELVKKIAGLIKNPHVMILEKADFDEFKDKLGNLGFEKKTESVEEFYTGVNITNISTIYKQRYFVEFAYMSRDWELYIGVSEIVENGNASKLDSDDQHALLLVEVASAINQLIA